MNFDLIMDALTALTPEHKLRSLLQKNGTAITLHTRVTSLAKLSPKEAFLLVHKRIRKADMYELITLLQAIYNGQLFLKKKYGR